MPNRGGMNGSGVNGGEGTVVNGGGGQIQLQRPVVAAQQQNQQLQQQQNQQQQNQQQDGNLQQGMVSMDDGEFHINLLGWGRRWTPPRDCSSIGIRHFFIAISGIND